MKLIRKFSNLKSQIIQKDQNANNNIIVLHGLMGSNKNFGSIMKNITNKTPYKAHLLNLRNHQDSIHSDQMTYEIMAHDIKEYIIKNDLKNVCLMGHSLGGKIVMKMAQLYPQLHNVVNKIAIIDILPINYNKSQNTVTDKTYDFIHNLSKINLQNQNKQELKKQIQIAAQDFSKAAGDLAYMGLHMCPNTQQHYFGFNLQSFLQNYKKLTDFSLLEQKYEQKAIFFYGSQSGYVEEHQLDSLNDIFTNIQIEKMHECGHWLHAEKPLEFCAKMVEFLNEN